jgi:hypothetical protein
MSDWRPQKFFNRQYRKENKMTSSEKQQYAEEFENIIYRLAILMLDTVKVTLNTLDDYQQLFDENFNQNTLENNSF